MKTIEEYLKLITSQYQNSTKFLKFLTAPLSICNDIKECFDSFVTHFDIDNASGIQLDIIGEYLGQSRILPFEPTDGSPSQLDDSLYRKVLKLKTITNYWDGSLHSIYVAWESIFTEAYITITDNMDMTATIELSGKMTRLLKDMIIHDMIIPRPEGVQYIFAGTLPETAATFGYDIDTDYIKGYDEGWWDASIV